MFEGFGYEELAEKWGLWERVRELEAYSGEDPLDDQILYAIIEHIDEKVSLNDGKLGLFMRQDMLDFLRAVGENEHSMVSDRCIITALFKISATCPGEEFVRWFQLALPGMWT